MKYEKTFKLNNGSSVILRNATGADGKEVYYHFNKTHDETDYLLAYADENSYDIQGESEFLASTEQSENEVFIVAVLNDKIVGTAGVFKIGIKDKIKHRAEFCISVLKDYWGQKIGRLLINACIECAINAGYEQIELEVVDGNDRAVSLYESVGFIEYGRNIKGFKLRNGKYQTLILMRKELTT